MLTGIRWGSINRKRGRHDAAWDDRHRSHGGQHGPPADTGRARGYPPCPTHGVHTAAPRQRYRWHDLAAGLAGVVQHVLPDPVVLAGLAVGGEFLAVTVQNVNFTAFVFFFTLPLLLLGRPTQEPEHAALRVATTVVGALVALGISALAEWLAQRPSSVPPRRPPEAWPGSCPG